jgi:hypothetical protein
MAEKTWGSDVPISMPQPLAADAEAGVPMFGFIFTPNGLQHDLSETEHDRLSIPPYAPLRPTEIDWGDNDLGGSDG